jgi:beta-glucosidase-like glycosyl hydrolase
MSTDNDNAPSKLLLVGGLSLTVDESVQRILSMKYDRHLVVHSTIDGHELYVNSRSLIMWRSETPAETAATLAERAAYRAKAAGIIVPGATPEKTELV